MPLRPVVSPAGRTALYSAMFLVQASNLPVLDAAVTSTMSVPGNLQEQVTRAAADARSCLSKTYQGPLPWVLFWRVAAKNKKVELSWMQDTGASTVMPAGTDRCILAALGKVDCRRSRRRVRLAWCAIA